LADWLTDTVIGTIDDKYLPMAAVDRLNVEGGGKRRRSSVFGTEVGGGRGGGSKVAPTNE